MASALLGWFAGRQRDLPWRRTRDPWAVLVSELMLQQTQVARVVPRFEAFLTTFPTPARCAASPVGDVITSWAGLGYNRRAVNLHRTATAVVAEHGGRLPDRLDALGARHRAVHRASGARVRVRTGRRGARRQRGRVLSVGHRPRPSQQEADAARPAGLGWTWNQAVLDLGATVCRPVPACRCPSDGGWGGEGGAARSGPVGPRDTAARFAGSDRQGRGRLVDALRSGPVGRGQLPAVMGWADDRPRADRVAATLVTDGLAEVDPEGTWSFPSTEVSPLS